MIITAWIRITSYNVCYTKLLRFFREFVFTGQAIRRDGSAALDLCYLACGRFDGFWELKLSPWDTAAGLLILREAGGVATRLDGSPYDIHQPDLLASNGHIHEQMMAVVRRVLEKSGP